MPSVSTAMTAAPFAGALAEPGAEIESRTSEESSAEIAFGVMVAEGTDQEEGCLKMAAQTNKMVGVVVHSHAYQLDNELGSTGLKPDVTFGVLRRGVIWVTAVEAVTPSDTVRVHKTGGTFYKTASAGNTVDISKFARWRSSAGAGELAKLEIDMLSRAEVSVDS